MSDKPTDHLDRPSNIAGPLMANAQEEKAVLESQKLRLEQQLLNRQLSRMGLAMEWLKSATVPAAIIGAALTFYVGFGQIKQAEQNRNADRFDKALTRLSSVTTVDRLTGVSGLRLFLADGDMRIRKNALQFLVNAASIETDEFVQSALINVFEQLKDAHSDVDLLNDTLLIALEQNRNLTRSIIAKWEERIHARKVAVLVQSKKLKLTPKDIPAHIPRSLLKKLSQADYIRLKTSSPSRFEELPSIDSIPLRGLYKITSILLDLGATSKNFKNIYCEECDFRNAKNLDGANFEGAFLARANFSRVSLKGASFKEADLSSTVFFSADLSGADLTSDNVGVKDYKGLGLSFPLFECANLKGANLSGVPLMEYTRYYGTSGSDFKISIPSLKKVKIDNNTKLDSFVIVVNTIFSKWYIKEHAKNNLIRSLLSSSELPPPDPIFVFGWTPAKHFRKYSYKRMELGSMYIQYSQIERGHGGLLPESDKLLKGHLSQTALSDTPLIREFDSSAVLLNSKNYQDFEVQTIPLPEPSCGAEVTLQELIDAGINYSATKVEN